MCVGAGVCRTFCNRYLPHVVERIPQTASSGADIPGPVKSKVSKKRRQSTSAGGEVKKVKKDKFKALGQEVESGTAKTSGNDGTGEDAQEEDDTTQASSRPPRRGECYTFAASGSCARGDACRFSHGPIKENKDDEQKTKRQRMRKKTRFADLASL